LSELGNWGKYTLLEQGTRAPLLVAVPGLAGGQTVDVPVEFIDLAPTVFDAAGLSAPDGLDGKSLLSLVRDNTTAVGQNKWVAFSQFVDPRHIANVGVVVHWMRRVRSCPHAPTSARARAHTHTHTHTHTHARTHVLVFSTTFPGNLMLTL